MVPSLGVKWEWIDATNLKIELRKGGRFHNGEVFDAHAVKFNFDYQRQHNPHRYVQVFLKNLKMIRVIDPLTLHVMLDQPDSLLVQNLMCLRIGAPEYMEKVGWDEFLKRPIGTGPYMVEGEVKDYRTAKEGEVYTALTANPHCWKEGQPRIKRI